jgi:hypothetical protein
MVFRVCCFFGIWCLGFGVSLFGASPTLDVIYPPGAPLNSTNTITLSGKFDPWPPKIWMSSPGISFEAQTNKAKVQITVTADAEPGPRLVRLYNEDGVSEPRFFVIGDGREITDTEPNNHFARPQLAGALPVTVNGRLDKNGDVDSFAIDLTAGQWLDARVDSHTIMSKLDGVLRLVTTNGQQLAWNHDFATLDPRVIWRATNDLTVVVQVYGFPHPATASVNLYGGESAIYRLHVSASDSSPLITEPCPLHADSLSTNLLAPPFTVAEIINSPNEEDRFPFTAEKDQFLELRVSASIIGSPLDSWVKIEDRSGKELTRNDDAEGTRDALLEWKASTNGTYTAAVGSLTHRGGPDFRYRLSVQPLSADFRATLSANSLGVTADSTNNIKFNVKRLRGHTNDLVASLMDLPEGVSSLSTNIGSKSGEISLPIIVGTNAPIFSGPVQLTVSDTITKEERLVHFPLTSRTEDNGVPGGYSTLLIDTLDHLWLTVKPRPAEPPKETAKK